MWCDVWFYLRQFRYPLLETAKRLFSEGNGRGLVGVGSRLAGAIDDEAPAGAQNLAPCYIKSEPVKF